MNKHLTRPTWLSAKILGGLLTLVLLPLANRLAAQVTYCTPTYTIGCGSGDDIDTVIINGAPGSAINDYPLSCPGSPYVDHTDSAVNLILSQTYDGKVTTSYSFASEDIKVWIDYDQDGTFSTTEEIMSLTGQSNTSPGTFSFTVPATATLGATRMRVRLVYNNTPDPCNSASYGICYDYTANIQPMAPPDNAGVDSLVNPPIDGMFCSGYQDVKVRVRNLGVNQISSLTVNWSIDGVLQTPVTYNSLIDSIYSPSTNMAIVSLGMAEFPFNTPVEIKAWTSMPNGVADNDNSDDTLTQVVTALTEGVETTITPGDTAICVGNALVLDAGQQPPGCLFLWSTGAVTQAISVTQPGTYSVKIQSVGGCIDMDTVQITAHPQPVANSMVAIDEGNNDFVFDVTGAQHVTTYSWDFGDGSPIESGPGPKTHYYSQPGIYTALAILSNECGDLVLSKTIEAQEMTAIVDRTTLNQSISVYPNPAKTIIHIDGKDGLNLQSVQVYNLLGQLVLNQDINGAATHLSVAHLAAGTYQLIIRTSRGQAHKVLQIAR